MSRFIKFVSTLAPDTKLYYENEIDAKNYNEAQNTAKLDINEKIKLLLFVKINNERILIGITNINIFKTDGKVIYKTKLEDIIDIKYIKNGVLESDKIELHLKNGNKETYGIYVENNCRIFYDYILQFIKNKQQECFTCKGKFIDKEQLMKHVYDTHKKELVQNENKLMMEQLKTELVFSIKKENETIVEQLKENKKTMEQLKNDFDSIIIEDITEQNYTNKIDINNATKNELEQIFGIGNTLSSVIIFNRPYKIMSDLINVIGNGKTYEYLTKISYISNTNQEYSREITNLENITNNSKITAALRNMVWKKYASKDKIYAKCYCCKTNEISMDNFNCGHIKSKHNNGDTTLENLRPICSSCNSSMGTKNMHEFMKTSGFIRI
jgi:DNA uptake protein ComE-like DNA-binding protein